MIRQGVLLEGFSLPAIAGFQCIDAGIDIPYCQLAEWSDKTSPANKGERKHIRTAGTDAYRSPLFRDELADQGSIIGS